MCEGRETGQRKMFMFVVDWSQSLRAHNYESQTVSVSSLKVEQKLKKAHAKRELKQTKKKKKKYVGSGKDKISGQRTIRG